ncbi:MAG: protein RecA [Candidatus Hepatoplasma vulgare]|nr:MAG: protein RecA [Candidatus Hepatoplasma sp.]
MNENDIKEIIKNIEKDFGKESVINFFKNKNDEKISAISTGSYLIDEITGINGYPKGRIIEIFGPESSGKTTLALHSIASAQKNGIISAFIDAEHSIDVSFAQRIGVDIKSLIISQPNSGEQALELVEHLLNTKKIGLIVIDSVAALTPQEEIDGNISDKTVGLQARLMAKSLRKLNSIISDTKAVVIFINQIREKIGVIFGNPEITPGGRALKFYSTLRIETRLKERVGTQNNLIGQKTTVKIIKNKLAVPYKKTEVLIYFDKGINNEEEILELALKSEVLTKNGSWYFYKNKKIAQGKNETLNKLKIENLFEEIKKETLKKM